MFAKAGTDAELAAKRLARTLPTAPDARPAPRGRQRVLGQVVHLDTLPVWPRAYKMLLETPEGWRCWTTVPSSLTTLDGTVVMIGTWVSLSVVLTPKARDPLFAVGSQPSGAKFVDAPGQELTQ